MQRAIDFYYDLISPFAHVALARLKQFPEAYEIRPVPVLLGAILGHWGQKGPAEISAKRLHTYRLACFLAEQAGLAMRFPPRHPFNPLGALRLLAGANDGAGADLATVRKAFEFIFEHGRAPDEASELAAFAEWIDVPVALASDEAAKARLRANTEQAISAGVFGVPAFVPAGDHAPVFWGVDSMPMLQAWLEDDDLFARPPYAALEQVRIGIERKV
ncbi:2-hydroxychromene-2-carboxylate isomerase [Pseudohoeflea coraliihabitans]|uniref:2-hydroxychromene-2-carboxylate isomerase n=1 Tax=Pseudohoeflea coraliihabitans TaxID=2860393 RepID=A0ABS6WRR6_9HYPH|nr:DsbA family protein [Pseudohoeflea sp. DP4N28-3]MBW3097755.1 DsbA family protein [Pseudohoeflea sp. DP4N28-3]